MKLGSRTDKVKKTLFQSNFSGDGRYDLIIVGGGLTGLSTALLYKKLFPESRVLILEKNHYTGGYVTTFERGGYVFETTQLMGDVKGILDFMEVDLELRTFQGDYMRRIVVRPDGMDEFHLPFGLGNMTDYLCETFPGDAARVRSLMDYSSSLFAQVGKLKAVPTLWEKMLTPIRAPKVIACLDRSYDDLLDMFEIRDDRLREVLETFSVFSGVPPKQASAIQTVGAMISSTTRCHRPRGWFDELPLSMTRQFQQQGGEIALRTKVERIVVENGRVTGVKLKKQDEVIPAERVVVTIDPKVAMRELVGVENLPSSYLQKLDGTQMSVSSVNVALGLDDDIDVESLNLDYPYNLLSTGLGTGEKLFSGFLAGDHHFSRECFHLGVVCPTLTTGHRNTLTIRAVPFGPGQWREWRRDDKTRYREERDRLGDLVCELVETHLIPDLGKHVVVRNISTPATFARYSGSPTGSIYDMASTIAQFGPRRLPMKTPVGGLFMPKFSHGIYGALMNGVQVVDLMSHRRLNNGNSIFSR